MSERFIDERPRWKKALGVGSRAVNLARYTERLERERIVQEVLGLSNLDFIEREPYFFGELPIINSENPTPVVAALIEEVANGNIAKESVLRRHPRVVQPDWAGLGHALVTEQLSHTREYGDHRVPGEFEGWFIGFIIHGSNARVLLQPHQVELREASVEETAAVVK